MIRIDDIEYIPSSNQILHDVISRNDGSQGCGRDEEEVKCAAINHDNWLPQPIYPNAELSQNSSYPQKL